MPATATLAIVAAAIFLVLALFQVALALGVPWGRAAWGGRSATLTPVLRVASGVSAVFFVAAAMAVSRLGGHDVWTPVPDSWLRPLVWALCGYTALGTLVNLASRSRVERTIWAPTSLVLSVLCGLVAYSGHA